MALHMRKRLEISRIFEIRVAVRSRDFGMTLAASDPIIVRLSTNGETIRSKIEFTPPPCYSPIKP